MQTSTQSSTSTARRTERTVVGGLIADLRPIRGPARMLSYLAAAWLASAFIHTVIFVFDDTSWAGPISWRKPIVFSASIGLLLWTFGWILDRLPNRPRLAWGLGSVFAVSSSAEIGLIAMQQWRGRPSHFNTFESGDALIFSAMGSLVIVMSICLVGLFIWSLVERPTDRLERIAAIAGLAMIMPGLGIGQWMITLGLDYANRFDEVPDTVLNGEAGVVKFPHAIAFHGVQLFMVTASLLGRSVMGSASAARTMWTVVAAYLGILVFSILQSIAGRAPFDLGVLPGLLLIASTATLLAAFTVTVRSRLAAQAQPIDQAG